MNFNEQTMNEIEKYRVHNNSSQFVKLYNMNFHEQAINLSKSLRERGLFMSLSDVRTIFRKNINEKHKNNYISGKFHTHVYHYTLYQWCLNFWKKRNQ